MVDHRSIPDPSFFFPLIDYEAFFKPEHRVQGFQVIKFLERVSGTQSESVNQALSNEPLCELAISASGPFLKAIGMGIMAKELNSPCVIELFEGVEFEARNARSEGFTAPWASCPRVKENTHSESGSWGTATQSGFDVTSISNGDDMLQQPEFRVSGFPFHMGATMQEAEDFIHVGT
ncbi:hypothetical protein CQW23_13484 [Capsicum baccatum]|uniref:Uncharacterized protein n=1 Tax=Capsicum baccatum TaxID=33114 RepID=A0A2G2WVI7_CAPBA|nr:hypothetical protein CQW23_13484 [Capsicum baccatum]